MRKKVEKAETGREWEGVDLLLKLAEKGKELGLHSPGLSSGNSNN